MLFVTDVVEARAGDAINQRPSCNLVLKLELRPKSMPLKSTIFKVPLHFAPFLQPGSSETCSFNEDPNPVLKAFERLILTKFSTYLPKLIIINSVFEPTYFKHWDIPTGIDGDDDNDGIIINEETEA